MQNGRPGRDGDERIQGMKVNGLGISLPSKLPNFVDVINYGDLERLRRARRQTRDQDGRCSFDKCFNFSRCRASRKVYVYPDPPGLQQSTVYSNILKAIRQSPYYTNNTRDACLFVLSLDTIDRDQTSKNYVRSLQTYIDALPRDLWNDGENHIIYNLYHGTWPHYSELDIGFDAGKAILARASASEENFRHGFDLSFPLFHPQHPFSVPAEANFSTRPDEQYLLSFKGKRYVYGIGSETRDSLYHLHDGQRIAMVTTCRHNTDWQNYKDERCEQDNERYDQWDYQHLLNNSLFCLTPRGRRLGSFRFLESLGAGCIPVVLSDNWVLPFTEIIDWDTAVIRVSEKNVLLTPDVVFSIPRRRIETMRRAAKMLYHRYFASVERIANSSLEIIFARLDQSTGYRNDGASISTLPKSEQHLTAVIFTTPELSSRLQKLVTELAKLDGLQKIIILWHVGRGTTPDGADFGTNVKKQFVLVNTTQSCLACIPSNLLNGAGTIVYLDERLRNFPPELPRMLQLLGEHPTRLFSATTFTHTVQSKKTVTRHLKIAYPAALVFHSSYLTSHHFRGSSPHCDFVRLSIAASYLSESPPIRVGRGDAQQWMQLEVFDECARQLAPYFPPGLLLPPADLGLL
ncbi:unnamed protein product, partial [Mesorhabditis spiculigera]